MQFEDAACKRCPIGSNFTTHVGFCRIFAEKSLLTKTGLRACFGHFRTRFGLGRCLVACTMLWLHLLVTIRMHRILKNIQESRFAMLAAGWITTFSFTCSIFHFVSVVLNGSMFETFRT
uniref:Uncharacterized protein n=1 Tax=Pyxicephalus adspersus TaxID=30357 RepID=A0AAV3AIC6_PYXAD|nr:TPA: hypothetical protein GDO54_018372 [Pyxicephalus adspersus]